MTGLTEKQRQIRDYLENREREGLPAPTHRELAVEFGFRSTRAAACHLAALARKGVVRLAPGKARSARVAPPAGRSPVAHIPVYGTIPAGFAREHQQEARGCVSIDIETLGFKPTARTFGLEVRGDSMIGRHIVEGDLVVLEHGLTPRNGDVVAALIDNESTLKTYLVQNGRPFLRAENPSYPDLAPAGELVIQGVMLALVRRRK